MKKLIVILLFPTLLYAAMSDAQALKQVRTLYGLQAGIGSIRHGIDTNWTRQITVKTPQCKEDVTIVGAGSNLWETAFASLQSNLGLGKLDFGMPLKGTVAFKMTFPDMDNVIGVIVYIDGVEHTDNNFFFSLDQTPGSLPIAIVNINNIDTTKYAFGLHSVCIISASAADTRIRRSPGFFFVDQVSGITSPSVTLNYAPDSNGTLELTKWFN